jgi:hypothetical protein
MSFGASDWSVDGLFISAHSFAKKLGGTPAPGPVAGGASVYSSFGTRRSSVLGSRAFGFGTGSCPLTATEFGF